MNDEVKTETTEEGETQVKQEPKEESLDDIISSYNVDYPPHQAQPEAQPERSQPQHEPPPVNVSLDPMDADALNRYATTVAQNQSALTSQIRELSQKLTQIEQEKAEGRIETEINKAVSTVNEGLNMDPDLVRVHLEYTAQKKPAFKRVWENRHKDPVTYNRALKAVQKEMASKYAVKTDPDLTETQTAISQSQRTMAGRSGSRTQSPVEETMANAKSQAEFDRIWRTLVG
ncbi:MAG: hypothetical protein ACWGQW_25415 [bacterium]